MSLPCNIYDSNNPTIGIPLGDNDQIESTCDAIAQSGDLLCSALEDLDNPQCSYKCTFFFVTATFPNVLFRTFSSEQEKLGALG